MSNKKDKLEIEELFMAKAGGDFSRCFHGTIKRGFAANGHPVVHGKIKVQDGSVCAMATHQDVLGSRLDELVLMVLDYGLHSDADKTTDICGIPFFIN